MKALLLAVCLAGSLSGCAGLFADMRAQAVQINADAGLAWSASVSRAHGGSRTIEDVGSKTIEGYDCAAVVKMQERGRLCVNIIYPKHGGASECTEVEYGSVSVCDPNY